MVKRYRKPLADKIIDAFNENTPSMFSMSFKDYLVMLQENFLARVQVKPGFLVPRYFKLFFDLLDHGNKGYICEHDLFEFMQDLDGVTK